MADESRKNKKKKRAKDIILNIILVIMIAAAVLSGGYLAHYYYKAKVAQDSFENLKGLIGDNDTEKVTINTVRQDGEEASDEILSKYAKLYEKNNDMAGWLSIDGTTIDYPVMYTPGDNERYLHLDFDGSWSDPGTPFIDEHCRPFEDRTANVLIYGHNMKSGIMFRELLQYENEDFYNEHKYLRFDTLYETGTYEVIGAFRAQIYDADDTSHFHYYEFFDAGSRDEFDEYIDYVKQGTPYDIKATAQYGDDLITLSTCASHVENGRFVVVAKKIKEAD